LEKEMSFQAHKLLFTFVIIVVLNTRQQLWAVALSLMIYTSLKPFGRGVLLFLLFANLISDPWTWRRDRVPQCACFSLTYFLL